MEKTNIGLSEHARKLSSRKWLNRFEAPGCNCGEQKIITVVYRKGMQGTDIQYLQINLIMLGYSFQKYGADGDFGTETCNAVKAFQKDYGLDQTGYMTTEDMTVLNAAMKKYYAKQSVEKDKEVVATGNVYAQFEPNSPAKSAGVLFKEERAAYLGETSDNDWNKIMFSNNACQNRK